MILRYFNVAGSDKKLRTGLVSKYSTHLLKVACEVAVGKRDKLIINGDNYDTIDGTTVRDYIHVSDLAEIHYKCAKSLIENNKSQIFNCGYGVGVSVKEVIKSLNEILKFKMWQKIDHHPTPKLHLEYLDSVLPEFKISETTRRLVNEEQPRILNNEKTR